MIVRLKSRSMSREGKRLEESRIWLRDQRLWDRSSKIGLRYVFQDRRPSLGMP
jgi:hypothetical protein